MKCLIHVHVLHSGTNISVQHPYDLEHLSSLCLFHENEREFAYGKDLLFSIVPLQHLDGE